MEQVRRDGSHIATHVYGYYKKDDTSVPLRYRGEIKWETNAVGAYTVYEYSVNNNIYTERTIFEPDSMKITNLVCRDAQGRVTCSQDAKHYLTTNIYHTTTGSLNDSASYGKLKYAIKHFGSATVKKLTNAYEYGFFYDSGSGQYNQWEASKSHYQGWITNQYDALGRLIATYYPDGSYEYRTYGCCRDVQSITRGNDSSSYLAASFEYDGVGRVTAESYYFDHPDNTVSNLVKKYFYDSGDNITSVAEYAHPNTTAIVISTNIFDRIGRLTEQKGRGITHKRIIGYDPHGNVLTNIYVLNTATGAGMTEIREYYDDSLLERLIAPGGRTNWYIYDPGANMITNFYPLKNYTMFVYDAYGRLTNERYYASDNTGGEGKTYVYDRNSNVIKEYDECGNCTLTEHDKLGRVTAEIIDMDNDGVNDGSSVDSVTQYTYEKTTNNILKVTTTGPLGNQFVVIYDIMGKKWTEYYDSSKDTEYEYNDPFGRLTKIYRPTEGVMSVTETYAYDSQNQVQYIDTVSRTNTYEYDTLNRLKKTTAPNGRDDEISYKSDKDLIHSITRKDGATIMERSYFHYDNQGKLTNRITDLPGTDYECTFTEYNNASDVSYVYGFNIWPVSNTYYLDGSLKTIRDGEGNVTTFTYDYRGRMNQRKFADNRHYDYTYYNNGLLHTRTNADNVYAIHKYDSMGNVTNVNYSDSTHDIHITYNLNGQKTTMEDGSGFDTYWSYYTDSTKPPLLKGTYWNFAGQGSVKYSMHYTYYAHNNMRNTFHCTNDSARIQKLTYYYDNANRITKIDDDDTQAGVTEFEYSYDDVGVNTYTTLMTPLRSSPETYPSAVQEFTYDKLGRRVYAKIAKAWLEVEPPEEMYVNYNPAEELLKAKSAEYQSVNIGTRSQEEEAIETTPQLVEPKVKLEPETMTALSGLSGFYISYIDSRYYDYNLAGQRTKQHFNDGSEIRYEYDYCGHMTNAYKYDDDVLQTSYMYSYIYDTIGNRTNEFRGSIPYQMWHNNLNQLTVRARWGAEPGQEENFYHNYNGCLTNDDTYIYAYNAENRLVETRSSTYKDKYYYDGLGRKVKTVKYQLQAVGKPPVPTWVELETLVYMYDGWNCITESDLSGSTLTIEKTYVWGSDFSGTMQGAGGVGGLITVKLEDDDKELFYCYDGNGNVIRLIDLTSSYLDTVGLYDYDPYGRVISSSGTYVNDNDYRFSTKRVDQRWGYYYYGYRHYSPDLGRWITRDPIGEDGGLNLYGFVENDPVDLYDLLGMASIKLKTKLAPHENTPLLEKGLDNWNISKIKNYNTLQSGNTRLDVGYILRDYALSEDKCSCSIKNLDFVFTITISILKKGDKREKQTHVFQFVEYTVNDQGMIDSAYEHEKSHYLANQLLASKLISAAERKCNKTILKKAGGWKSEYQCKTAIIKEAERVVEYIKDKSSWANKNIVHIYHKQGKSYNKEKIKIIRGNIKKDTEAKIKEWKNVNFCDPDSKLPMIF